MINGRNRKAHGCRFHTGPPGEMLSLSGHSLAESAAGLGVAFVLKDSGGKIWPTSITRKNLPPIGRQDAHQRRGAAGRGQRGEVAPTPPCLRNLNFKLSWNLVVALARLISERRTKDDRRCLRARTLYHLLGWARGPGFDTRSGPHGTASGRPSQSC
jgi:hypothetical protein